MRERRGVLRRLVLANSEGYWAGEAAAGGDGCVGSALLQLRLRQRQAPCSPRSSLLLPRLPVVAPTHCVDPAPLPPRLCRRPAEHGEFVPLASKHSFNLGTLGILLGMLQDTLQGARCAAAAGAAVGQLAGCSPGWGGRQAPGHAPQCVLQERRLALPTPPRRAGHRALQRPVCRGVAAEHDWHAAVRRRGWAGAGVLLPLLLEALALPALPGAAPVLMLAPLALLPRGASFRRRGLQSLSLDDIQVSGCKMLPAHRPARAALAGLGGCGGASVNVSTHSCCQPPQTCPLPALPCPASCIQCRLYREPVAELGRLTSLTQLSLSATQRQG